MTDEIEYLENIGRYDLAEGVRDGSIDVIDAMMEASEQQYEDNYDTED